MPYIGNTVQNQGFAPAIDYFSGNGVTVTFTLSRPVASVAQIICAIDNVIQNPSSAYTVSGNSITFTSAPLAGTNNIWVEYTSLITTYAAISQSPSVIGDITASGGYLAVGNFGNSFIDGTIVDYVTGNGRITTGPADGLTIYNGGTAARNPLMTLDANGNALIGTISDDGRVAIKTAAANAYNPTGYNGTSTNIRLKPGGSPTTGTTIGISFGGVNAETYIGQVQNASSYGDIVFQGYNGSAYAERMRIDSSGRVTIPSQPAFVAYLSGANLNKSNTTEPIPYNATQFNTGNNYSTSTYRFTAPIAGRYFFHTIVNVYSLGTGANMYCGFYKNGTQQAIGTYNPSATGGDQNIESSIILNLAANDYVTAYIYGAGSYSLSASGDANANWQRFEGYLIG